ncbi:hypothetical protein [Micromonospora sp. NPDC005367]|uniref:hypothetical protein n=1 Tax=Micromonospora sp. NPDC005367 TaxID=3155590 RepID=UPI0033A79FDC
MTDDTQYRQMVRQLFTGGRAELDDLDPGEPDSRQGNHVPREGGGMEQRRPADYDDRNYVGELFGVHPNQRNLHQGGEETFRDWTRELFARAGIHSE